MKPIKLIMSAFGSYAGRETIDFTDVQQGIFLITGDTGAGKTTIFDAIMYALYDETSGGCRDAAMMRSQYAADETETFVEFTFLYNGEKYSVRRNPEYRRPGKRRNADGTARIVKELNKVELTLPDQTVFKGKKRETDQQIAKIIGLDAEQFRQVAMIAQGDFLKLLHAESKERKVIFSKIFHTKIYWRIQEILRVKAKELSELLEDNRKLCQRELHSVQCDEQSELKETWEKCRDKAEFSLEDAVQVLEQIVCEGQEQNAKIAGRRKETAGKIELLNELLRSREAVCGVEQKLSASESSIGELAHWLKDQEEIIGKLQGVQEKAEEVLREQEPVLTANITRLKDSLEKYGALEQKQAESKKQQKELVRIEKELSKTEAELEKSCREQNSLELSLKKLENVQVQMVEAENHLRLLLERREAVGKLQEQIQALRTTEHAGEKARKNYEQRQKKAREASLAYEELYLQFFREQAGILAEQLEEGEPCPVCGSCQHPHKADLSEHAPAQDEVEQAKAAREKAEKLREKAFLAYQQEKQKLETLWAGTAAEGNKLLNLKTFCPDEKGGARVEKELDNVDKQVLKAGNDVEKVRNLIQKKGMQQSERENLQKICKNLEEHLKKLEQEKQQTALGAGALEREITLIQSELTFGSAREANRELRRQNTELEELRKTVQAAQKECQKQIKLRSTKEGEKKAQESHQAQLEKELKKAEGVWNKQWQLYMETAECKETADNPPDFREDVIRADLQELQRDSRSLEKNYMQGYAVVRKNAEALERLEKYCGDQAVLQQRYTLYSDLSKTANGNLSGSIKLDFETYVQRQYFRQIISAANQRLVLMNNQQFILQCRDMGRLGTQGQVGLDLDVYHLVNDSARDVKTLSGGESFMAALAMALGLADIIQNEAGAIRLDTMFVDEGFGSLDDEARAQAIQVLLELADNQRLVGIISHVNELKEQIDTKLLVTKDDKGSHVQWKM